VIARHSRSGRNHGRTQIRRRTERITLRGRRGRDHGIQLHSVAGVVANHAGSRRDHWSGSGQPGTRGAQALGRGRTCIGPDRKQVGDRFMR
jgi:hypothetical protein